MKLRERETWPCMSNLAMAGQLLRICSSDLHCHPPTHFVSSEEDRHFEINQQGLISFCLQTLVSQSTRLGMYRCHLNLSLIPVKPTASPEICHDVSTSQRLIRPSPFVERDGCQEA